MSARCHPYLSSRRRTRRFGVVPALACTLVVLASSARAAVDGHFDAVLRERVTYVSALDYDESDPGTGWFWTQRLNLAGTARTGALTARLNIQSALLEGGTDAPIERNLLDAQEAWFAVGSERRYLRFGRQELRLGAQRLIGWRDGTNVRRPGTVFGRVSPPGTGRSMRLRCNSSMSIRRARSTTATMRAAVSQAFTQRPTTISPVSMRICCTAVSMRA